MAKVPKATPMEAVTGNCETSLHEMSWIHQGGNVAEDSTDVKADAANDAWKSVRYLTAVVLLLFVVSCP